MTTRVGLQIPDLLTYEEWERAGHQLASVADSSSWWLGDWLTFGRDHYSDRYKRGIQAAGLQYQTLRNYAWVARQFPVDRRRSRLTFQHHAEVASLPVEDQDTWLTRAEELSWTTKQLRSALREAVAGRPAVPEDALPVRRLAIPGDRFESWRQAAERDGIEVGEWVLATLDAAAGLSSETAAVAPSSTDEPGNHSIPPPSPNG